jgi:hypothetical protein
MLIAAFLDAVFDCGGTVASEMFPALRHSGLHA